MDYTVESRLERIVDKESGVIEMRTRFFVFDLSGRLIDDANGHGYHTIRAAHRAAAYRFKGGRENIEALKAKASPFWKTHRKFAKELRETLRPIPNSELVKLAAERGIEDFDPKFMKWLP